jgi:hypothetical protein
VGTAHPAAPDEPPLVFIYDIAVVNLDHFSVFIKIGIIQKLIVFF